MEARGGWYRAHQLPALIHDPNGAAMHLAIGVERIFKTLVVQLRDTRLVIGIIPVPTTLDFKKVARQFDAKDCSMAAPRDAERATGYAVGCITPFGLKESLPIVLDVAANGHETIFVSAGIKGTELEVQPSAPAEFCNAKLIPIIR